MRDVRLIFQREAIRMSRHLSQGILFALAALFSGLIWGQQKYPLTGSGEDAKGQYVQQHMIDVDDAPGHQIRILEIHRTYPADKPVLVDGERIAEAWVRSFSNYTGGIGPTWGYTTWFTEKGNKAFIETVRTSETQATDTGARRGTYNGTSRIVGGTGRFSKIRGTLVDVAKFDTDQKTGYNFTESHGEYWFEK